MHMVRLCDDKRDHISTYDVSPYSHPIIVYFFKPFNRYALVERAADFRAKRAAGLASQLIAVDAKRFDSGA